MTKNKLPIILCSSVIRSTRRGDSHGGLYKVDLNNETFEQVVDWDNPNIDFDSGGGDRGLRGLDYYNGFLYATGAKSLFRFDKDFNVVGEFTHPYLDGTHENDISNGKLYCIANCFDAILGFNLSTEQFDWGLQFKKGDVSPLIFNPNDTKINRSDSCHLDSVRIIDSNIYFAGSTTLGMYCYNMATHVFTGRQTLYPNTHNAQPWRGGVAYNLALEGQTIYEDDTTKIFYRWPTPVPIKTTMGTPGDHARINYTRGMVLTDNCVIAGTSPARVMAFNIESGEPIAQVEITTDIRNSICGMTIYED